MEGQKLLEIHTSLQSASSMFVNRGDELVRKGKGYNISSFP